MGSRVRTAEGERPRRLPAAVNQALSSSGKPLEPDTRASFESRFQHDFSGVRIHTGGAASSSAAALGASAYAVDDAIVFGSGEYAPETNRGRGVLAHELTHVVQARRRGREEATETIGVHAAAEREAQRVGARSRLGMTAGPIAHAIGGIALTPTGDKIKPHISYGATDWSVTKADEAAVIALLAADPDASKTIEDLETDGRLGDLINRVDSTANRRQLLQVLGAKLNASAGAKVEKYVAALDRKWQLQFNLGRFNVTAAAPAFANQATLTSALVSKDSSQPFTGSGATGKSPADGYISDIDQGLLAAGHKKTVEEYSNPISGRPPGDLPTYLATLSATQRSQQAELLLKRQISTLDEKSYAGNLPSRAQVIKGAAKAHKLHPQMLAGFLLAEQRDQSKKEDAKDYLGATSLIMKGNTSIGLGQVVVSTAQKNDLFEDLLSPAERKKLSHNDTAKLLASDEYNIFAVAKYIRKVADDGSKIAIATLPNTQAEYPAINMPAYAADSSTWPDDNIKALGSEYTSRAWDDALVPGWGDFVFEAYKDVIASGVF